LAASDEVYVAGLRNPFGSSLKIKDGAASRFGLDAQIGQEFNNVTAAGSGISPDILAGRAYQGVMFPSFAGHYVFGDWQTAADVGDGRLFIAVQRSLVEDLLEYLPLAFNYARMPEGAPIYRTLHDVRVGRPLAERAGGCRSRRRHARFCHPDGHRASRLRNRGGVVSGLGPIERRADGAAQCQAAI
jgi:hypothetical protein